MNKELAKQALDKVIDKAKAHFYKPIQIAEILYRDRVEQKINFSELDSYRNLSKGWRDSISSQFSGRTCTSSARYQDNLFNDNAIPPAVLEILAEENRTSKGAVEAYIYRKFSQRFEQVSAGLNYCATQDKNSFKLDEFLDLFRHAGSQWSIDKIYEIVVYALFSTLIEVLEISVTVSRNVEKIDILEEFEDFAKSVIQLSPEQMTVTSPARIHRVGVTNAADCGLDMWANFGLAIQIKHQSLTQKLAEKIVSSLSSDRIVIICRDAKPKIITSLPDQIGWKSKIQSVIVESDLLRWYDNALRGRLSHLMGERVLQKLSDEIKTEFPITDENKWQRFLKERGYDKLVNTRWN